MPNWIDLVNKMKQSITGKVITGTWVSFNKFLVDNEEIDVLPSSGVGDLLDKFNTPFPRNCTVILVDKIFINGETQKVIPWTFSF
jgi:hypothetical protein